MLTGKDLGLQRMVADPMMHKGLRPIAEVIAIGYLNPVVVTLGAGSITQVGPQLLAALEHSEVAHGA